MLTTEMENYLSEKSGLLLKILEITREEEGFIQSKNYEKFMLYLGVKSKLMSEIRVLDKRFDKVVDDWNSGRANLHKGPVEKVNGLIGGIRQTIEKITELQDAQRDHFIKAKEEFKRELVKERKTRKAFGCYQDQQNVPGILNIKR